MSTSSRRRLSVWLFPTLLWGMLLILSPALAAEASITIDVAMEEGLQVTAPTEWLQLLTSLGYQNVSMRSARPADEPSVAESGTKDRPRYRVTAMLTRRDELVLPGGRFTRGQRNQIKDYFDRLAADGPNRMNAQKGSFGLTKEEFDKVHADLSLPLTAATKDEKLAKFVDQVSRASKVKVHIDPEAQRVIDKGAPIADEAEALTTGTATALLLAREGLVLVPTKEQGKELMLRIARRSDIRGDSWPVGWKIDKSPSQLAPKLFDSLNAEVEGFTLTEAMEAIGPRMEIPIYWDHEALTKHKIDPATIDVKFPRTRTHLKRVVDNLLFQARLVGEVRVDEGGKAFYWISR